MKICVIGCGLRTPLLASGIARSDVAVSRLDLFDVNPARAQWMAKLCQHIVDLSGRRIDVLAAPTLEESVRDCSFVISSIRVGDMEGRARDERLAFECGFAGQETTGPAGFAMAMRTIPVALEQARVVERLVPDAWLLNFTNPAGIVTEAICKYTGVKTVGICDTPSELIHKIAWALGETAVNVECDYVGLNHLGWVTAIRVNRADIGARAREPKFLRSLYPVDLFAPELIAELDAIPSEYVYFYYQQEHARQQEEAAGATRGEELLRMNGPVLREIEAEVNANNVARALQLYVQYLNRRNASYMSLEAQGGSLFSTADPGWDPFEGPTGYHRVAVDAIRGLQSDHPHRLILNVPNGGAIEGLGSTDVVEVPCQISRGGARPIAIGPLPENLRALTLAVKQYERLTIAAALGRDADKAAFALMSNPIVGNWDAARQFVRRLGETDPQHFPTFQ